MIGKITGSVMILVAGGMIGVKMGQHLKLGLRQLKCFERIITMIQGEIRYHSSTLPEAMEHVGHHTDALFGEMLRSTAEKLKGYEGKSMDEVWQETIAAYEEHLYLTKEQTSHICQFGENLGYLDKEMQLNTLELCREQVHADILDMEETIGANIRLYQCLGLMGGILVVLIIV